MAENSVNSIEALVAVRQARNLTSEDMQRQLKLHPKQITSLEAGDWAALPGLAFVRGTLRSYGRVVGADVEPLLESIGGHAKAADLLPTSNLQTPMPSQGMLGFGSGGGGHRWAWFGLLVVGLAALALFFGQEGDLSKLPSWLDKKPAAATTGQDAGNGKSADGKSGVTREAIPIPGAGQAGTTPGAGEPATAPAPVAAAPVEPPKPPPPPPPPPEPPKPPNLIMKFRTNAWVEIRQGDGKLLLVGTQKEGSTQELRAEGKVNLTLGNGDKIDVEYEGKLVKFMIQPGTGIAKFTLP